MLSKLPFLLSKEILVPTSVKVSAKYQIAVPQLARKKLNIKKGDQLLVDVQDGVIVMIPQPKRYADYLQGLHGDIWQGVDSRTYLEGEREVWTHSAND